MSSFTPPEGSDIPSATSGRPTGEQKREARLSVDRAKRSAARVCKCGHKSLSHYHENAPIVEYALLGVGPCHASVYTTVPMGVTVTRCDCRKFEASDA